MQDFDHFMDNMGFLSEEDNLQFLEQLKIFLPDNEGKLLDDLMDRKAEDKQRLLPSHLH